MTSLYRPPSQDVLYERDISIRKSPFISQGAGEPNPAYRKAVAHQWTRFFLTPGVNIMNVALTFTFPGIPTSHSIKFIDPSADFAGLA